MLPGEAFLVALCELLGKLIDGQSPEVRDKLWQQWMAFWQPAIDLLTRGKK
jgi:hypothetical protein